jgi:hypothetical protein
VAHRNYTIREEAGQSTKTAFLWQITESVNDQGKKIKILTKLVLVQCNLFSLSITNVPLGNKRPILTMNYVQEW